MTALTRPVRRVVKRERRNLVVTLFPGEAAEIEQPARAEGAQGAEDRMNRISRLRPSAWKSLEPRPWCACGKVRLTSNQHMHTEETGKRLWLHQADKCCCWALSRSERRGAK